MSVVDLLKALPLTLSERRLAELVLSDPDLVAFGTVASVAKAAGVGNSTVMRFTSRLGFSGFSEFQTVVRAEMSGELRKATDRVRRPAAGDPFERAMATEVANVRATLAALDVKVVQDAAAAIAACAAVVVVSGDSARGAALDLTAQLSMVHRSANLADPGPIALSRSLAPLGHDDVVVVIDTPRYETAVVGAIERAVGRGVRVLAVSDSHLSALGHLATWSVQAADEGSGPFDSFVGVLAFANLLVTLVVSHLGTSAVRRLDALGKEWDATRSLYT